MITAIAAVPMMIVVPRSGWRMTRPPSTPTVKTTGTRKWPNRVKPMLLLEEMRQHQHDASWPLRTAEKNPAIGSQRCDPPMTGPTASTAMRCDGDEAGQGEPAVTRYGMRLVMRRATVPIPTPTSCLLKK